MHWDALPELVSLAVCSEVLLASTVAQAIDMGYR